MIRRSVNGHQKNLTILQKLTIHWSTKWSFLCTLSMNIAEKIPFFVILKKEKRGKIDQTWFGSNNSILTRLDYAFTKSVSCQQLFWMESPWHHSIESHWNWCWEKFLKKKSIEGYNWTHSIASKNPQQHFTSFYKTLLFS